MKRLAANGLPVGLEAEATWTLSSPSLGFGPPILQPKPPRSRINHPYNGS
jgi:hypothetical protein